MIEIPGDSYPVWTTPQSVEQRPQHISPILVRFIFQQLWIIILKQKPTQAHVSEFKCIKFLKQSAEPREHEIYLNSENFQHFLKEMNVVSVISTKLGLTLLNLFWIFYNVNTMLNDIA